MADRHGPVWGSSLALAWMSLSVAMAAPPSARPPLVEIPEIRAENGVAKATFRVARATVPVGDTTVRTLVYDGA